jgi:hypothetical protein
MSIDPFIEYGAFGPHATAAMEKPLTLPAKNSARSDSSKNFANSLLHELLRLHAQVSLIRFDCERPH